MSDFDQALKPELLLKRCNPADFDFSTTEGLPEVGPAIGQERALEALQFGLSTTRDGFNLFALGPSGLGKTAAVKERVAETSRARPAADDWCYVHNFKDPSKPRALRLPAGEGKRFADDIHQLIEALSSAIPAAFEVEGYREQTEAIEEAVNHRQASAIDTLRAEAQAQQIALIETPTNFAFAPINEKAEALSPEDFQNLPAERQQALKEAIADLHERLQKIVRQFPAWQREAKEKLAVLNRETAASAIRRLIDGLKVRHAGHKPLTQHLNELENALIEHAHEFIRDHENGNPPVSGQARPFDHRLRYGVNLLVDNGTTDGAPVVFEQLPHHANLIGRVEHQAQMGTLFTDFTMIRPGALHRANGGYLILDAHKLLTQPYAWETLKRALQSREIRIEPLERALSLMGTASLEPEPIPLDVKIILTGDRILYYLLNLFDPEFQDLFKIPADFEDSLDRNEESSRLLARLIGSVARNNHLRPLDRDAVIRVVEHSSRLAEDGEKLGTHLRPLGDLLKEADYWADQQGHTLITREAIQTAIDQHIRRSSRVRDQIYEDIRRGSLLIDTQGSAIGQVNGLSVITLGDFSFGQPSRITATTRLGTGKIVDIERDAELGGPLHSKGVMILSAFLSGRYARIQPLSLSASLVFEQSYAEVEGDSASLAELCALLSSLSDLPALQSLAVTGSVNQLGRIQPIGGVNEKVEGFFDVCKTTGLTGHQGVMIPKANIPHLMLREDVVAAAAAGQFHVYAVTTVDEAVALLLNTAAGERDDAGEFPAGTVNHRVEWKLREWAIIATQMNHTQDETD